MIHSISISDLRMRWYRIYGKTIRYKDDDEYMCGGEIVRIRDEEIYFEV